MPDRIRCINPNCRRTFAPEKHPGSTDIICGKCWKALPARFRLRHRSLAKRDKTLNRLVTKRATSHEARLKQWHIIADQMSRADRVLWGAIRSYFTDAAAPPAGLDNFLKENGIA